MGTVLAMTEFACPMCHGRSKSEVEVPEINWASSDKLSDLVSEDHIDVTCSVCGEHLAAYAQISPSLSTIAFEAFPDVPVTVLVSMTPGKPDDSWLNTDIPPNAYEVFMNSYHHVGDILAEYGHSGRGALVHSAQIIHRMVFVHQICALEAYLGDTLVDQVVRRQAATDALIAEDNDLKDMKLSLAAIAENPRIVRDTVKSHLQGVLYHNLSKVAVLYNIALNVNLWPNDQVKRALFVAISHRHDYVHRNGRDKAGAELPPLERRDVQNLLEDLRSVVEHVHAQCMKCTSRDPI